MCFTSACWKAPDQLQIIRRWINEQLGRELDPAAVREVLERYSEAARTSQSDNPRLLWQQLKAEVSFLDRLGLESVENTIVHAPHFPQRWRRRSVLYGLLSLLLVAFMTIFSFQRSVDRDEKSHRADEQTQAIGHIGRPLALFSNELPAELQYHTVNTGHLKAFLEQKSSLLADSLYLEAIVTAAETYNIHPLLLFAITGQEQGFVPKTHKSAKMIASNPFNVYHSWKDYNTTIRESADIAVQTIVRWSKDRPEGEDPIHWINRKYAEDPQWYKGVSSILTAMKRYVEAESTP